MSSFKSVRLSSAIRLDIASSMLEAWQKKQPKPFDLKKIENQIADTIWKRNYGKLNFSKIPSAMLKTSDSVSISIGGNVSNYKMSEQRPYPKDGYSISVIEVHDELPKDIIEFNKAKESVSDWDKKRKEFKEEINTILDSVTSTGQLIQLWPEAEQYLPPFAADPSKGINLPALKTTRLNEMLGIK